MTRFKNILAVYNYGPGGDDVLVQAVNMASAVGAKLTVVDTLEPPQSAWSMEEARLRLQRIVPWITQEGVSSVTTDVLFGTAHAEIIRRVICDDHDLVIVSAEGTTALKHVFVGSLATNLLLKCPCAVWLLKPGQSMPCMNVVAALKSPLDELCERDINLKILDLATAIASAENARLHVVHFWDVEGKDGGTIRSEIRREDLQRIVETHRTDRWRTMNALLNRCATWHLEQEVHLPRGRPELQMTGFISRLEADVIVMGSASRIGFSRLLMGNLTETVLESVRCSLLAVKPDEFAAPIGLSHVQANRMGTPARVH
jgi:universal stress protein E